MAMGSAHFSVKLDWTNSLLDYPDISTLCVICYAPKGGHDSGLKGEIFRRSSLLSAKVFIFFGGGVSYDLFD